MAEALLDTLHRVETPEGIDLEARLAGPVPRALAYALDLALRMLVWIVCLVGLVLAGEAGFGIALLLGFLLEWFYPVAFEYWGNGQTPGKRRLGIAVVGEDLHPVGFGSAVLRNLLRTADFLPFAYLAGLVSMAANPGFQRLGDVAAGTLVIHRLPPTPNASPGRSVLPSATPCPPPIPLALDEQLAIIALAERHARLSPERQRELADILRGPLRAEGDAALARLHGIAHWLLGER